MCDDSSGMSATELLVTACCGVDGTDEGTDCLERARGGELPPELEEEEVEEVEEKLALFAEV